MKSTTVFFILFVFSTTIFAQNELYMAKEFMAGYENNTRSADGLPGENYWQNTADYTISAELLPESRQLTGSGTITYYNNSPDTLRYVVVKLLQNIYKKGAARDFGIAAENLHDGVVVENLKVNGIDYSTDNPRQVRVYGTNMYIILPHNQPLNPDTQIEIAMDWHYTLAPQGMRTGAFGDSTFFIGYWYPQIAVYDDIYGWDRELYSGLEETYNDWANYNVSITCPAPYLVWASGELQNEAEIYSGEILSRIAESRSGNEVVHIISTSDLSEENYLISNQKVTWEFKANDLPDFAWAASANCLWDATSVEVDAATGRRTWVNSVYSESAKMFEKVAFYAQENIEYFSKEFPAVPYPYHKHITVNAKHRNAMEFPMLANNALVETEAHQIEFTAHEIAHAYFPFYVLSNERQNAWLDEGWVKLIGERATEQFGYQRTQLEQMNTKDVFERHALTSFDLPLLTPSSSQHAYHSFQNSYAKSLHANLYLLDIMKEKGVEQPLRQFIEAWAGKHPTPYDYFNFMSNLAGEDLSWYWRPWYLEFTYPDLAVVSVSGNKALIENKGGLPIPLSVEMTYSSGEVEQKYYSPLVWKNGTTVEIAVPADKTLEQITIGDTEIVDIQISNNSYNIVKK